MSSLKDMHVYTHRHMEKDRGSWWLLFLAGSPMGVQRCLRLEMVSRPKRCGSAPWWFCTCCGNWATSKPGGPAPAGFVTTPTALSFSRHDNKYAKSQKVANQKLTKMIRSLFIQNYSPWGKLMIIKLIYQLGHKQIFWTLSTQSLLNMAGPNGNSIVFEL